MVQVLSSWVNILVELFDFDLGIEVSTVSSLRPARQRPLRLLLCARPRWMMLMMMWSPQTTWCWRSCERSGFCAHCGRCGFSKASRPSSPRSTGALATGGFLSSLPSCNASCGRISQSAVPNPNVQCAAAGDQRGSLHRLSVRGLRNHWCTDVQRSDAVRSRHSTRSCPLLAAALPACCACVARNRCDMKERVPFTAIAAHRVATCTWPAKKISGLRSNRRPVLLPSSTCW